MLDSAVPQGFPEQVPPVKVTVSTHGGTPPVAEHKLVGAVPAQLPLSKTWNVTVPVGVGPPPAGFFVTIAWSRTGTVAAPPRSINESVTSLLLDALRMWVAIEDANLLTASGSHVLGPAPAG